MVLSVGKFLAAGLILCAAGCALTRPTDATPARTLASPARAADGVQRVSYQEPIPTPPRVLHSQPSEDVFPGAVELSLASLLDQVIARNPSLMQMTAAWQAASARYPQARAINDPMLGVSIGPGSIGSNEVDFAYRIEASQKLALPGKRRLRGERALAEADAAASDIEDMRLQLIQATKNAFYEYYLVGRALAVNEENLRLLKSFKANAETRYRAGLVPQQDVLQADVELGRQQERQVDLEQRQNIAIGRINTLLSLPPNNPLPAAPLSPGGGEPLPKFEAVRGMALAIRPDLQAIASRVQAEVTALELARREFLPEPELLAAYDAFWQEKPLRTMVGVRVNLPVALRRRFGALAEAQAKIVERQAELVKLTNDINFQVQEAYEQARKGKKTMDLYGGTILSAAEANVKAAESAYVTGRVPFLTLIEAQRNFIGLRDRYYEVTADYFRSLATLERAVGGPLPSDVTRP